MRDALAAMPKSAPGALARALLLSFLSTRGQSRGSPNGGVPFRSVPGHPTRSGLALSLAQRLRSLCLPQAPLRLASTAHLRAVPRTCVTHPFPAGQSGAVGAPPSVGPRQTTQVTRQPWHRTPVPLHNDQQPFLERPPDPSMTCPPQPSQEHIRRAESGTPRRLERRGPARATTMTPPRGLEGRPRVLQPPCPPCTTAEPRDFVLYKWVATLCSNGAVPKGKYWGNVPKCHLLRQGLNGG